MNRYNEMTQKIHILDNIYLYDINNNAYHTGNKYFILSVYRYSNEDVFRHQNYADSTLYHIVDERKLEDDLICIRLRTRSIQMKLSRLSPDYMYCKSKIIHYE